MARARFLTAACVTVAALLTGPVADAASPPNPTNPDGQIYLTYVGHLERQAWLGHTGSGTPFGKLDVVLEWRATAHFPDQASFGRGVDIDYQVLTGTISLDDSGDPSPQTSGLKSCDATLSERISSYQQTATTEYDLVSRRYRMNVYLPPLTAYLLRSSDNSGDYCTVNPAVSSAVGLTLNEWPQGNSAAYANAWQEYDTFPGGKGPFATRFTNLFTGSEGEVEAITDTITASSAKLKGTGKGPFLSKRLLGHIKDFYAGDIKAAIDAAKPYCLNYLTGLGSFGSGVLLLGAPGTGPILAISGSIVATMTLPFCAATLSRIHDDLVIANDPPDWHFNRLAQPVAVSAAPLPNCHRVAAALRSSCRRIETDAQRVLTAARRVAAVAAAAATTINRYSAANLAANWTASARQGRHLLALTGQSHQALAALTAAGKAFARDLLAHRLNWRFNRSDAQRAIAGVLSLLAKRGVSASALGPYAGSALNPSAFDVLRQLRGL